MVEKLTGHEAIAYAEQHQLPLHSDADNQNPARDNLTIEEALAIARTNPSLVWIERLKKG